MYEELQQEVSMKNILVTGACGFIGSHFVKLLEPDSGHALIIIDKMTYAADVNRIGGIKKYENRLYIGDICNKTLCDQIIKRHSIDTIVNFAAETHVDRAIADSSEFMNSNILGVHTLLELARKYNLRFVQVSTDEVYGSIEQGSFTETNRLNPGNPYSASKAGADLLALSYCKTYGLPVVITRSSNNYGPFQHTEKFIPKMITDAMAGKPLSVYGKGGNIRNWIYVTDNCEAIRLVMEHGKSGEIYNIGSANEMTNNQVAQIISLRFKVPITYITDRAGHDFRYSISNDKIKKDLGWEPCVPFIQGLNQTIQHYAEWKP